MGSIPSRTGPCSLVPAWPSSSPSVAEGCVTAEPLCQNVAGGLELVPDEAQPKEPGAHCVLGVFTLLGLGACGLDLLCHLAQGKAELDVGAKLACVDTTLATIAGVVELEEAKLNGALGKGRVEVEHMVAGRIVMGVTAPVAILIPNVGQTAHGFGLFPVQPLKKCRVNSSAVMIDSASVEVEGVNQQALMACHDVCQVPQGPGRVTVGADVDVYSASVLRVADGSGVAKLSGDREQVLQIVVGEDRGGQLGGMSAVDAGVAHGLPSAALPVFAAPNIVAAAIVAYRVLGAEVSGDHLGGFLSGDVAHLKLDPDGLLFHFLNLPGNLIVHGM